MVYIKLISPICSYIPDCVTKKEFDLTRFSGLFGILAPVIGLTSIAIAILLLDWFSWTDNYLSDLGGSPDSDCMWGTYGYASVIFNFGLVAAGILGIGFGIGLNQSGRFKNRSGTFGTVFLMLDACMLVGVGLFSETTGAIHTFFSVAFFVMVGFALLFLGMSLFKSSDKKLGWFVFGLLIFGLVSVPLFLLPKPIGSNAIAEIIPIISASIFSIFFGYKLFSEGGGNKADQGA
jgi:hypothetical membrane protein